MSVNLDNDDNNMTAEAMAKSAFKKARGLVEYKKREQIKEALETIEEAAKNGDTYAVLEDLTAFTRNALEKGGFKVEKPKDLIDLGLGWRVSW